jgi:hypothetical protein
MRAIFAFAAIALLAACPPNTPPHQPPSPPGPLYVPPDGDPAPVATIDAAPAPRATGASCASAADCDSGTCEGLGCGDDAAGRCAAKERVCTMDMIAMCGCDGATFQSSSTCPGRRYAHRGACAPPPKKAAGETCLAGDDCDSGVCEGQGCGDDAPGKCAPSARKCTRDRRPFCGCDGAVFMTSGSCPGRRYAHPGKC